MLITYIIGYIGYIDLTYIIFKMAEIEKKWSLMSFSLMSFSSVKDSFHFQGSYITKARLAATMVMNCGTRVFT